MRYRTRIGVTLLAWASLAGALRAGVHLPSIFGDHMVLQQEAALPVWGTASPGEKVKVTVGDKSAETTAGPDGKWTVKLAPLAPGTPPVTMTVSGKNTLTFNDVLVGDVWLASGQSNMAFHVLPADAKDANYPQIRFFIVPNVTALHPVSEVKGQWVVCSPDTIGAFSAVAYLFARELRATLKRPIGLIGSYWVGSGANCWVSIAGLRKDPALKCYVDAYDERMAALPQLEAAYPALQTAYQAAQVKWEQDYGAAYKAAHQKWYDDVKKAQDAGLPAPPKPSTLPPEAPAAPIPPDGGPRLPSAVFNAMIAPLIPYGIKGVIWYQGESNHSRGQEYKSLLTCLIADWRDQWGEGNFPFLIVQLPNFTYVVEDCPFVRESQLKVAQTVPNTGLAVTIDVGDPNNGHPHNKLYVGLRLAQAAKHVAYGQDVVYSGPIFESEKFEGNAVRLTFTQVGGGLVIGSAPYLPAGVQAIPTTSLVGFEVAGADQKWVSADARIDGNSVVVSSPQVQQPVAARYAWANTPRCNLYNKEGLPASPFRTDNWPPAFKTDDWNPYHNYPPDPAYAKGLKAPAPAAASAPPDKSE